MRQRILIIGAGFAGLWSALSAARLLELEGAGNDAVEIALVAPQPALVIRPRLYEANAANMVAPLQELFDAVGVRYIQGTVEKIDTDAAATVIAEPDGVRISLAYDRLVLAAGSQLFRPQLPGLREYAFSVDQLNEAVQFEDHCQRLAQRPATRARNTVVVAGGGFTGIEIAAELPARLSAILGRADSSVNSGTDGRADGVRVIIVESANEIGPELGPGPRPVIVQALSAIGIECRLGTAVTAINADSVVTSSGERIETNTVVWTAGMRASPLTAQIAGQRDPIGRLHVDRDLKVPTSPNVFATGDCAYVATDNDGHHALMSCQHALRLGRSAGNNAAASLLGRPTTPYRQHRYVTGLDLGSWGAVHTEGWDRKVVLSGAPSKARKHYVNSVLIYPPKANRAEALAAAKPPTADSD